MDKVISCGCCLLNDYGDDSVSADYCILPAAVAKIRARRDLEYESTDPSFSTFVLGLEFALRALGVDVEEVK